MIRTAQNLDYPEALDSFLLTLRPGIILVDMQDDYFGSLYKNIPRLIENQSRVLKLCAEHHLNVAVLEDAQFRGTTSPLLELISKVEGAYYYSKHVNDGFTNPRFTRRVRSWNNPNLFYMGIYADACIIQTAETGRRLGYTPHSSDAVISDISVGHLKTVRSWFRQNGGYF
jgi:isochorismate hydrolase